MEVEVSMNNGDDGGFRNQIMNLRFMLVFLWTFVTFTGCFAASMVGLLHLNHVSFHLSSHPHWDTFFMFDPNPVAPDWWITKFGHFICFGVEEALLYSAFRTRVLSTSGTVLLALATELLQIPFGRDGRMFDVLIDTTGALVSCMSISTKYRGRSRKVKRHK